MKNSELFIAFIDGGRFTAFKSGEQLTIFKRGEWFTAYECDKLFTTSIDFMTQQVGIKIL